MNIFYQKFSVFIIQFILSLPEPAKYIFTVSLFYIELAAWYLMGKPTPCPKVLKVNAILKYAEKYNLDTLVETGTYLGETIELTKKHFKKIYSIELSKNLYLKTKMFFSKDKNIKLYQGDSSDVLPRILKRIKKPCLFWLDAHYSRGITAIGSKNTPIMRELRAIARPKTRGHVVLIDDAQKFKGIDDYPTIKEIKGFTSKNFPNYKTLIKNDIIQIYPNEKFLER